MLHKFIIALAAIAAIAGPAMAQTESSSSSSVVRRTDRTRPGTQDENGRQVTARMQQHFADQTSTDADVRWMRVIYRQLDVLDNVKNTPLYFPEELIDGQENLFRIIMRLLAENKIPAYEYLDGREIFNDTYRIKVGEMLDRFQVLYSPAKGSTEKNPKFTIEESDVPANEVLSYYIIERWTFDARSNSMKTVVEAICPVLHRAGDFGGEAVKYPMFWVRMDNLRPYLATQYIFTDDDNNLARYTYEDYFTMGMYDGEIYKTRNLRNKSMAQLFPDPDDLKRAQDSIQHRLDHYSDNLWVPSREEVIAAREAREAAAAAAGDSTALDQQAEKKIRKSSTRSSRAKNKKKAGPKKESKSSKSSSAVRSVRNRRR